MLQFGDHFFLRKGHQLNDKASGTLYGIICIHQNTKSHTGRGLFGCCKIIGQVITDLAGL